MLGYFTLPEPAAQGDSDRLLAALAARLAGEGLAVQGAVQVNTDRGRACGCDMDLTVLGDPAPPVRISQALGPGASGCRLDAGALEIVAARVAARLAAAPADILVLTKFGKQESFGRGFCQAIAQAVEAGVPVLLHVAPEYEPAFAAFAGDLAQRVAPESLDDWCRAAAARAAA